MLPHFIFNRIILETPSWIRYYQRMINNENPNDTFMLYDLKVDVVAPRGNMICNHIIGDYFELKGENLSIPAGKSFSIYALAALLPLLPAKQRPTDKNDWMTTDQEVACPDPHCGALFRITRTKEHVFRHSEVTAIPLKETDTFS